MTDIIIVVGLLLLLRYYKLHLSFVIYMTVFMSFGAVCNMFVVTELIAEPVIYFSNHCMTSLCR